MKKFMILTASAVALAACSGATPGTGAEPLGSNPAVPVSTAPPTTVPATTTVPISTTTSPVTTTTLAPEPALSQDGGVWSVDWASVNAFWSPADEASADPKFFIHTNADSDGFFFSLELYTTGYGQLWTGELGEVAVGCMEGVPGPNSTGVCPYFDPDGSGPLDVASAFVATGSITINKLDDSGYDIFINEIVYPDGTTVGGFGIVGP